MIFKAYIEYDRLDFEHNKPEPNISMIIGFRAGNINAVCMKLKESVHKLLIL